MNLLLSWLLNHLTYAWRGKKVKRLHLTDGNWGCAGIMQTELSLLKADVQNYAQSIEKPARMGTYKIYLIMCLIKNFNLYLIDAFSENFITLTDPKERLN